MHNRYTLFIRAVNRPPYGLDEIAGTIEGPSLESLALDYLVWLSSEPPGAKFRLEIWDNAYKRALDQEELPDIELDQLWDRVSNREGDDEADEVIQDLGYDIEHIR